MKNAINPARQAVFTNVNNIVNIKAGPEKEGSKVLMAKKGFKSAVLLILRENFCALRNFFKKSGQSPSKPVSRNPALRRQNNEKPPNPPKPAKICKDLNYKAHDKAPANTDKERCITR